MRAARHGEQMLDGAGVVAQHAAVAHAEPPALGDDDAARFERLGRLVDRLAPAGGAEVRAARRQLLDEPVDPRLEVGPGDRVEMRKGY